MGKACEIYQKAEKERREAEEKNKLEYCSNDKWRLALQDILEEFQKHTNQKVFRKPEFLNRGF